MAVSAKTCSEPELMDKDGQVSRGRFEPAHFSAGLQTDHALLANYMKPEVTVGEAITDPVRIKERTTYQQMQV